MKFRSNKTIPALVLGAIFCAAMIAAPAMSQPGPDGPDRPARERRQGVERPERQGQGPRAMRGQADDREPGHVGRRQGAGGFGSHQLLSPRVREELQLTDEQVAKLKTVQYGNRTKAIDLNAALEKAELEMQRLMDPEGNLDRNAIYKQIDAVGKLRAERTKLNVDRLFATREVLTKEQTEKLREVRAARHEQRGRRGQGEGVGPRRGRGEEAMGFHQGPPQRPLRGDQGEGRGRRGQNRPAPERFESAPESPAVE